MNKGIVLDVGSGNNWLWQYFHKLGWTNIIGIDPFIDNDIFINGKKLFINLHLMNLLKIIIVIIYRLLCLIIL